MKLLGKETNNIKLMTQQLKLKKYSKEEEIKYHQSIKHEKTNITNGNKLETRTE